jgi:tetratricopeptide (TPR) repeat protein
MNSRIIFLPIPEPLRIYLAGMESNDFRIDPDIPIPVEINNENFNLENLSTEMILSGMLKVIETKEAGQEWIDYYCRFVLFLRPDIITLLKKIKENGLNEESFLSANKLIQEGKPQEALESIRVFLEKHPLVWNGWFMLGWALRLLGRYADGEAAFRKAIELGGTGSDTLNELAICLMEMGDITGAKRELEGALKEDPENVKIISNLGMLAAKSGDTEGAAAFFRTVLELDSNDPLAMQYLHK